MMEKALIIILFMYSTSFAIYGGQYVIGDVFNVTLTSYDGTPLKSYLLDFFEEGTLNTVTGNIVNGTYVDNGTSYSRILDFSIAAAYIAWELVTLLTGLYIFNFIYLMGVPLIFVTPIVILYLILLARAIIGYIRGI